MFLTLIFTIFIIAVLICIYFVLAGLLTYRKRKLIKLLQVDNPHIKSSMEAFVGHFPNHYKEIKKTEELIENMSSKSVNEEVIITYRKVKFMRKTIKTHTIIMISTMIFFVSLAVMFSSS